jgi:hypothetical protein
VSSVPHNVVFRLVDEESEVDLIELYQAEYSLNNSTTRLPMIDLESCQQFARSTPQIYSFTAYVSSLEPLQYVGSFTLSAKYVSTLPEADFIVYPKYKINEESGTITILDSTNYTQSSGTYFYGEGHTEPVNLSANYSTANWYVGNALSAIEGQSSNKPITTVSGNTSIVSLTSYPALETTYNVSLRVTNSEISLTGPINTYDDVTGTESFYPFFASTLHISNSASELNNYLRDAIQIKSYPIVKNYQIVSQLSGSPISLPYNYTNQRFLATVEKIPADSQFLTESFYATQWELDAIADTKEPNPDWSNVTALYPLITGYSFPLGYFNQNNIDDYFFKCSAGFNTTVTTTVSVYKSTTIDLVPNDWLCRTVALPLTSQEVVVGMPVGRFYTSNYYYLTGEEIKIYNITEEQQNITVTSIVLSSDQFTEPLVFDGVSDKFKITSSNDIGLVTLSATINFIDNASQAQSITTILENFIEIVSYYDLVDFRSCRSVGSIPSSITESYPKLSPNEWVTENNINSIFLKFADSLDELREYARSYNTSNPIIGRLEPVAKKQGVCLGKYCLPWQWASRKCDASTTYTTWQNTACDGELSATWAKEDCSSCSLDEIDCGRAANWIVPTISPNEFNVWKCIEESTNCKYTGICRLNEQDKLIVAYKTELQLLDNDYYATLLNKQFFIDEVFQFTNIVGVASTVDDMVAVLDSTLSKVSVFSIDKNYNFILFSTWGRFGLSNSKTGFNKPQDIHIDNLNNVWICDTGNKCVKKLTVTGRHKLTVQNTKFEDAPPVSVCVDVSGRVHCLTEKSNILVFDEAGNFAFEYSMPNGTKGIKINSSFNREIIHVTYNEGIAKFCKNGVFLNYVFQDKPCISDCLEWTWKARKCNSSNNAKVSWLSIIDEQSEYGCVSWAETKIRCQKGCRQDPVIDGISSIVHDRYRNIYVTLNNTILKIIDRMTIDEVSYEVYAQNSLWSSNSILIHREEYIQPWVYLKSFHRLWDNIELFRNSLFYEIEGCKSFTLPTYSKEDLKLGQNEIVTNATINRLSEQLWTNLQSIAKYFDPTCKN